MWGAVSWEQTPGGRDSHNPDVSKQNRPTLGMAILIDMKKKKPNADQWEGQVYNAKDGEFYSSTIKPVDPNHLQIQGCVLGFLCGGETWSRVADPIPSSPANSMARTPAKMAAAPPPKTAALNTAPELCRNPPTATPKTAGAVNASGKKAASFRISSRCRGRHLPSPGVGEVRPLARQCCSAFLSGRFPIADLGSSFARQPDHNSTRQIRLSWHLLRTARQQTLQPFPRGRNGKFNGRERGRADQ